MTRKKDDIQEVAPNLLSVLPNLLEDLRCMIEETRRFVAVSINQALSMLYWRIGRRINEDILRSERAEYGEEIVSTLSRQLEIVAEYLTALPPKELLQQKLHKAIVLAKKWLENHGIDAVEGINYKKSCSHRSEEIEASYGGEKGTEAPGNRNPFR